MAKPALVVTCARRAKGRGPRAEQVADFCQAPFMPRETRSTADIFAQTGAALLYVVGGDQEWIADRSGRRCMVHQGRSMMRATRTPTVPLLRAVGPAACVVDGTGGLGQDALVLASCIPRVIVYESARPVFCLLSAGLERLRRKSGPVAAAAQRIELRAGDVWRLREEWRAESPDALFLDPMWPRSYPGATEMEVLAAVADARTFDADTLRELARSVQRLVLKVPPGHEQKGPLWSHALKAARAGFLVGVGSGKADEVGE